MARRIEPILHRGDGDVELLPTPRVDCLPVELGARRRAGVVRYPGLTPRSRHLVDVDILRVVIQVRAPMDPDPHRGPRDGAGGDAAWSELHVGVPLAPRFRANEYVVFEVVVVSRAGCPDAGIGDGREARCRGGGNRRQPRRSKAQQQGKDGYAVTRQAEAYHLRGAGPASHVRLSYRSFAPETVARGDHGSAMYDSPVPLTPAGQAIVTKVRALCRPISSRSLSPAGRWPTSPR